MDQNIINFAVYEDGKEFVGIAKATLPDLTALTQSVSGAGIAGNIDAVVLGHYEAMTLTLNFRTMTKESIKLSEPRLHNIDLRVAQQNENTAQGVIEVAKLRHVLAIIPKSDKGGNVAPATLSDGSGEYTVHYWATYMDGVKVREIDPVNCICEINGVDYLAPVRSALGK